MIYLCEGLSVNSINGRIVPLLILDKRN